jgi:FHS family L-fucose permease-like MFS transporter
MHAASTPSNESVPATYAPDLQAFVFVLFFAFGGITSLNDVLIPKLKALFTLNYGEVMLIQSFRSPPPRWCGASAICDPR